MTIKQLTVFVKNSKGSLVELTKLLAQNDINIRALSVAETQEFGMLRLIVNNVDKATKILEENNYLIKAVDVIGIKISDKPGGLAQALEALDKADINVEYMYAFMMCCENGAYVVIRVADNNAAQLALQNAGLKLMTEEDVSDL